MTDKMAPPVLVSPVSLGLIGAGGFGRQHLVAAEGNPAVAISAVLSQTLAEHPTAVVYHNLDRFLAHPGLQGVVVVAPNPLHLELVMAAFQAGRHVLVEKPLANSVKEGAILVRGAAVRGLVLAVGHNSRRAAHVRAMRRLLDEGVLGRVVLAEGHFSHDGGLRLEPENWRSSPESCPCGPLNLLGIHEIDTLQYLLGPVASVSGWQWRLTRLAGIPDVATTLLQFASGALGYVGSSYANPRARAVRLFGTRGNARWDEGGALCLDTPGGQRQALPLEPVDTLREQLTDFAASIRENRAPEVDGLSGLYNVAVMEAALESNRRGEAVTVREMFERAGGLDLMKSSG
jgi:predicted dehydrogenase